MQTSNDIFREINKSRAYLRSSSSEFARNPVIRARKHRGWWLLAVLNPWEMDLTFEKFDTTWAICISRLRSKETPSSSSTIQDWKRDDLDRRRDRLVRFLGNPVGFSCCCQEKKRCAHVSPGRNTGQIMRLRLPKWATGRNEATSGRWMERISDIVLKLHRKAKLKTILRNNNWTF